MLLNQKNGGKMKGKIYEIFEYKLNNSDSEFQTQNI